MKLFDGHVHIGHQPLNQKDLLELTRQAGVDKTVLLSEAPDRGYLTEKDRIAYNTGRLKQLIDVTSDNDQLFPVHFVNVIEEDAAEQVDTALKAGVVGFKVICSNHFPDDQRAMPIYRKIAAAGKPILFHSGILYDFGDNAKCNRPGNFEALLYIPDLRFALAHIGWPWCDEMVAVFGKFLAMEKSEHYTGQKMYIDLTPGTPPIYREEALSKLLSVGYNGIEKRMLFGSDCFTDAYSVEHVQEWVARDKLIYDSLGIKPAVQSDIFYTNALDFWGLD